MKECRACGQEYEDDHAECPFCGAKNEDAASAAEETSFLAKKAFGRKIEKAEKKNHFITNGIVALFSLLLFVLTFFAGAKISPTLTVSDDFYALRADGDPASDEAYFDYLYGKPNGINQSTVDILVGAFGLIETDKDKMAEYIVEASEKYAEAFEEAYKKYEKDVAKIEDIQDEEKAEKEAAKFLEKIADYAAKKSGINAIKVNYYMARLGTLGKSATIQAYAGAGLAILMGVLLLVTLVSAFVFFLRAGLSLAKRRAFEKPFRAPTVPLVLLLTAFAVCAINPIAAANGATIACVVVSLAGILLLCAAKRLILDKAETFTVKSLIRGGVSLLCAALAFFLLCGTLFTVKIGKYTAHASMGLAIRALLRGAAGGSETYAFGARIGTAELILLAVGLIAWLCAVLFAARSVLAACADLWTGNDEYETKRGKKTTSTGTPVAAVLFAVVTLVLLFVALSSSKPSVSVGVVFALVFLAVGATVKGLLPNELKAQEQEEG